MLASIQSTTAIRVDTDPTLIMKEMEYENRCRSPDSPLDEIRPLCPQALDLMRLCIPRMLYKLQATQAEKIPLKGRGFARVKIEPNKSFYEKVRATNDALDSLEPVQIGIYSVFPKEKIVLLQGLCTLPSRYLSTSITTNLHSWIYVVLHVGNKTSLLATHPIETMEPSVYHVDLDILARTNRIYTSDIYRTRDPSY